MEKLNQLKGPKLVKELIKPADIQSEEQFFEVRALCGEYGNGDDCFSKNSGLESEDDLLF